MALTLLLAVTIGIEHRPARHHPYEEGDQLAQNRLLPTARAVQVGAQNCKTPKNRRGMNPVCYSSRCERHDRHGDH